MTLEEIQKLQRGDWVRADLHGNGRLNQVEFDHLTEGGKVIVVWNRASRAAGSGVTSIHGRTYEVFPEDLKPVRW